MRNGTPEKTVALIRGINVGGKTLKMETLRQELTARGFGKVKTYIQSGNVVFDSPAGSDDETARTLEQIIRETFGYSADVMVRSAAEWRAIVERNPYPPAAPEDGKRLHLFLLARELDEAALARLKPYGEAEDRIHVAGREMYVLFGTKMSDSPLFKLSLDKLLGLSATARNWNTVMKLAEMCEE
ncbi:DUF1697 domain-containing protein [Paenibacillus spiritus]|uniref:DUF1697 domain-containing protein n=1 Tax=Paenibacillus spiritus TaxID=2496557 RepID=A0A5J5FUH0_9BACL|nr:DUF1697 domain-containing protein [Paenibacillus spiritus]KAA8997195.1 DUF1697 domain-containing protein [Paenibacillus spiritus]